MTNKSLLKLSRVPITDKITVINPTVSDVLDDEQSYYTRATLITSTPFSLMVQLDDWGINSDTIDDFQLFGLLIKMFDKDSLSMLIEGIEPQNLVYAVDDAGKDVILRDEINGLDINRAVADEICSTIRKINGIEKKSGKSGNAGARAYLLEKERKKIKRRQKKPYDPFLEKAVIAMVNNRDFPYDYAGALNLNMFSFMASVPQVQKLKLYEQTMSGIYNGTLDSKKINMQQIKWI